jgi:hypothetical protein
LSIKVSEDECLLGTACWGTDIGLGGGERLKAPQGIFFEPSQT